MNSNRCRLYLFSAMVAVGALACAESTTDHESGLEDFRLRTVAENLSRPWALAFLPDGGYLVTERTGSLVLLRDGSAFEVAGVPKAASVGQGGMLDIALSPNFRTDSLVYLSYAERGKGGYGTAVARGKIVGTGGNSPRLEAVKVIYRALPRSSATLHFGCRLVFSGGYLFITLGERGSMSRAQDTGDPYGSVLRLNPDGSVPTDNPFAAEGNRRGGGLPEIWAYGSRNAQGMAVNPLTGDIWLHEHGPKGGDEVNIVNKGSNYGWPKVTYGVNYDGSVISDKTSADGITDPVVYWDPSIAPSGFTFYTGTEFPKWRSSAFVGALAGQHLRRLDIKGNRVLGQEVLLKKRVGRIRDVREGPDGYIYLLTDAGSGRLYRLEPVR